MNKEQNILDITEFVKQLEGKVIWDSKHCYHWSGVRKINGKIVKKVVVNSDMMVMCSTFFGRKYDMLSYREKRIVREDVFRKLRGVNNERS